MNESQKQQIEFTINGKKWSGMVHPMKRLLDTIREDIGLTGTKEGCGEGECGACTVLVNDRPVMSCLMPTCQAHGAEITTIEGIEDEQLHPVQEAFIQDGGAQCGMCTPGMILTTIAYMKNPALAHDLPEVLAGNLCRCTGYGKIFRSCHHAMEKQHHCEVPKQ